VGKIKIESGTAQALNGGPCEPIGITGSDKKIHATPFHIFWRIDRTDADNAVTFYSEILITFANGKYERETVPSSIPAGQDAWCFEKRIDRIPRGTNRFQLFINTTHVAQWTVIW